MSENTNKRIADALRELVAYCEEAVRANILDREELEENGLICEARAALADYGAEIAAAAKPSVPELVKMIQGLVEHLELEAFRPHRSGALMVAAYQLLARAEAAAEVQS